jgi:trimethylamine--corrinoid protein Co-methyltransferase
MQAAVLCGANFILHAAGWLEGGLTMGYEKFVMDADLCGAMHTYLRGFSLEPDEFAIDAFNELGPGKHFFSTQHTLRHYETAFYDSSTANNDNFEQWRDGGSTTVESRAAKQWKQTLGDYEAPPMDDGVRAALDDFVERRKREMPDAWY